MRLLATAVTPVTGEITHKCVEQDTCYLPETGSVLYGLLKDGVNLGN